MQLSLHGRCWVRKNDTLRVVSDTQDHLPLKPSRIMELISPLPWNQLIIRFLFHLSFIESLVHVLYSGIADLYLKVRL